MGFVKYSVTQIGIEEDLPGWVKKAKEAEGSDTSKPNTDTANIKEQEQSDSDTKDK